MLLRRTKILATLGPSTDKPGVLEELFDAGIDVVRLNFSHGSAQDHIDRANRVRELSKKTGRRVGILADLQGPKIRIERFKENKVWLDEGQDFALDINLGKYDGDHTQVGISYEPLAREVKPGTRLLLDDGRVVLDVVNVENNTRVNTKVVVGGDLSNNKGINLLGGGLSAAALTEKDKEDIKTIAVIQADYVAISFPRTADDMHEARALLEAAGSYAGLVAKIERAEAMDVIDEIIMASDASWWRAATWAWKSATQLAGRAKAFDQTFARIEPGRDYCHANDGIDDRKSDPDPCRGVRRGQRDRRRYRCDHAVGGDRIRQTSGENGAGHGAHLLGNRKAAERDPFSPPHDRQLLGDRRSHRDVGDVHGQPH